MNSIYWSVSGTKPKNLPTNVNGTSIATTHITAVKIYTIFEALLSINGFLAVLII